MLDLKANYKTGKGDLSCRACKSDNEESQKHIFQCPVESIAGTSFDAAESGPPP